jgi:hypothetical protein
MITHYVPTTVGPSKLDLILADAPQLSDEKMLKVILITDINRLGKLITGKTLTPKDFYRAYELSVSELEQHQHDIQIGYNTIQYQRAAGLQGHDF